MIPAISVVVTSYNHAPFVAQTIESVLAQSFEDFEVVVFDDCSTDGSPDVVRGFTDRRIFLQCSTINRGASAAMNAAVRRARGEFIAILNSDDFALPGRLASQIEFLRAHPEVAAVFGLPRLVDENGAEAAGFVSFLPPFVGDVQPRQAWLRHFFFHGNCLCSPAAMIRRSAYLEIGGDDRRLTNLHDFDRWIRLLEKYEICVLPDEVIGYRVLSDGSNASAPSPAQHLRSVFESYQIFKRYQTFAPAFLREIFAEDLASHRIDAERPSGVWLSEIALMGTQAWHPLFALDTLHESAASGNDVLRLRQLAGSINAFRLPDLPV